MVALAAPSGWASVAPAQSSRQPRRPPATSPASKPAPAPPVSPRSDTDTLVEWLTGHFSNEEQAPLRGITPGGSDKQAQDRVHAHVRRVLVPALPGTTLYIQWNRDRRDGPIARQRLWTIVPGGVDRIATLKIFGLTDPEPHVDALESPESLQTLEEGDLLVPADSCELPVTRNGDAFLATTLPACPSTIAMRIPMTRFQVRLRVTAAGFTYSEAGYADPDFTPVLLLPKKGSYEFVRTP
jgi:hypothetical protein